MKSLRERSRKLPREQATWVVHFRALFLVHFQRPVTGCSVNWRSLALTGPTPSC
jgi:hypothetical protein